MKQILVTGGAGFLGSYLCERLLSLNAQVLCIDNFFTGSRENIKTLLPHPLFTLIEHDVCSPLSFQVDEIYNFACPASPIHYQADPVQTTKTSIYGAMNVLELSKQHRCKVFQASTSEVYGDPQINPQKEDYWGYVNPIGPRSCYDEGKRCAETLFFDYFRKYAVPIKLARIFNTYGPRMRPDDGRVVSNFIVQALLNQPLSVYGDGMQTRSFCYVDDLIEGCIKLMATPSSLTGPINLGNPAEIQVVELAKLILDLTGSSSSIIYHPLPLDDPKQRKPDISLAQKHLAWTPITPLKKGLLKTIDYFEKTLSATK